LIKKEKSLALKTHNRKYTQAKSLKIEEFFNTHSEDKDFKVKDEISFILRKIHHIGKEEERFQR